MVLNRNPDNFFAETEQVAFCTAHVVPGIDFSNDPLLAGRIHSYVDTQISRLGGPNFHEIPINAPIAPGAQQPARRHAPPGHPPRPRVVRAQLAGRRLPVPGRRGAGLRVAWPPRLQAKEEQAKVRGKPEKFADHYTQATLFYESQTPVEQAHIAAAFRFELSKVTVPAIRERMVASLRNASEELARKVAEGLGMDPLPAPLPRALAKPAKPEVTVSPTLSLMARPGDGSHPGPQGRDAGGARRGRRRRSQQVQAALLAQGAVPRLVGPRIGPVATPEGDTLDADASLENEPGFLFDALVLPDGEEAVAALAAGRPHDGVHQGPVPPLQDHPGAGRFAQPCSTRPACRGPCPTARPIPACSSRTAMRALQSMPSSRRSAGPATPHAKPTRRGSDARSSMKKAASRPLFFAGWQR